MAWKPDVEGVEPLVIPCFHGYGLVIETAVETFQRRRVDGRRDRGHGRHLKRAAHESGLDDVAEGDTGDERALLRFDRHETLVAQAGNRFRDRLTRNAQTLTEIVLVDARARLQPERDNGLAQVFVDEHRLGNATPRLRHRGRLQNHRSNI